MDHKPYGIRSISYGKDQTRETNNRDPVNEKTSSIKKVFSRTNEIHSLKIEKNPELVCSSREQDRFVVQIFSKADKTWAELWERVASIPTCMLYII